MQPFVVQLFDLTLIQLTNWRWSWRSSVIVGAVFPVFSIVAFGIFAADSGPETLGYVLTGNMVFALLMEGVGKVSSNFSYMRSNGAFVYFASLPIYRSALIVATALAFLLLSLPATAVTLLMGGLILHLPLNVSPWLVIVIPLICVSLSGLGALLGLVGQTPEQVNSFSLLVSIFLFGFGPVLIPPDRLPPIINTLSVFSPATYAASALRQTILGVPDRLPLAVDMLVLGGIAVGLLALVNRQVVWRDQA